MEIVIENPAGWASGTRIYRCGKKYFAVEAPSIPEGQQIPPGVQPMLNELLVHIGAHKAAIKAVARPTVIIACKKDGTATNLTPLHVFPAGTTHEDALKQAGLA